MKNRIELRAYIRYQLGQLASRNGAHEFEQLCFALARMRHVSNLQPATGPVQAGGDQGRDCETYRTYLQTSSLGGSAFLSLVSADVVVGACTLEKGDIAAKVRRDLATMFGAGLRPDAVIYFCEADVPVARRHQLIEECLATYGASLSLQDGSAIADQLADPDTFWIAEHYLSVPMEMFPSDVGDEDYHKRRTRWLDERTQRIESKLDSLVRDESVEAADRRWAYIQSHPIREIQVFFVLKGEVGFDWFREVLNNTRLRFGSNNAELRLGSMLDASTAPNTKNSVQEKDRPSCSFWEMYPHAQGYWIRRTEIDSPSFSVVSGFDLTVPWSMVGLNGITTLSDLASVNSLHVDIPPAAYLPGVQELVIDFVGDTFAFWVALSDEGLESLHKMAHTFHALGGKANLGSIGTGFSGVALLEKFRKQLNPKIHSPRKGIAALGVSSLEGRGMAFYPKKPPDFDDRPEAANYRTTFTISGARDVDLEDGLEELKNQIAQNPNHLSPYRELALRYAGQGQLTDSIRCLEGAIEHAIPDASTYALFGEVLRRVGRFPDATEKFARALELDSTEALAHHGLGLCLDHRGDIAEAVKHFERATLLEPDNHIYHANLGMALVRVHKYPESIAAYQRSIECAPNEACNWMRLGVLFDIQERHTEAVEALRRSVGIEPDNDEAQFQLGRVLFRLSQLDEAIEALRQSISRRETPERLLLLTNALSKVKCWTEAENALLRAIEGGAAGPDIEYTLACLTVNQGRVDEAKTILTRLLSTTTDHPLATQLLQDLERLPGEQTTTGIEP